MAEIVDTLSQLLRGELNPTPARDLDAWWARHMALADTLGRGSSFDLAVRAGFAAHTIGYAFASGYQVAVHRLLQGLRGSDDIATLPRAVCVTESGGNHARAIEARLSANGRGGWRLEGQKSFVTLGAFAQELLVVAREGVDTKGRPKLAAVVVEADAAGLKVVDRGPSPFVPEVPHAELNLSDVELPPGARIEGDAYPRVVKAFRSVEDIHVFGALMGWAIAALRRFGAAPERVERCAALVAALNTCARFANALEPAMHRVLGPLLVDARTELESWPDAEFWSRVDPDFALMFSRDTRLLGVAGRARAQRLVRARGG